MILHFGWCMEIGTCSPAPDIRPSHANGTGSWPDRICRIRGRCIHVSETVDSRDGMAGSDIDINCSALAGLPAAGTSPASILAYARIHSEDWAIARDRWYIDDGGWRIHDLGS